MIIYLSSHVYINDFIVLAVNLEYKKIFIVFIKTPKIQCFKTFNLFYSKINISYLFYRQFCT